MRAWTDYPIAQLGDTCGKPAPLREVAVLGYDGDKYCRVSVCGVQVEIKSGYLYTKPGRADKAKRISVKGLPRY